jgi:iron complex transport system permease protein
VSLLLSAWIGSVHVPIKDMAFGLLRRLRLISWPETPLATLFLDLRLPRVLLGALCGASLSLSGGVMQGVFRNPLADPYILGQASGATLGAALCALFGPPGSFWLLPLCAFCGAFLFTLVLLVISEMSAQLYFDQSALILVGVALGSLGSALTGIALYASQTDQANSLVYWLFGSLALGQWPQIALFSACALPMVILLVQQSHALDLLSLGDTMAAHLGVSVVPLKRRLLLFSSVLTALVVAFCGTIGFVGLVVPHMVRKWMGPRHNRLLPSSCLLGAAFLPLCDTVSRSLLAPLELPVGIVTALIGVPFFLSLLLRRLRKVKAC